MDWKDAKDLLVATIIGLVVCCLTSRCSYDIARDDERTKLVQELCSKTEYDFCVKVPQKPVYVLKGEK